MAEQMTPQEMDEAAEEARQHLAKMVERFKQEPSDAITTYTQVVGWWQDWYLVAGHKRLGRILLRSLE